MKKLLIYLAAALLLAACLPQNMRVPQSPLLSKLERKSGLIAYVGIDGNIYTSDQGGGHLTQYTQDATLSDSQAASFLYYQYPTWSADSSHLAFVGLSGKGSTVSDSSLHIAGLDEKEPREVYSSKTEHPMYLYWSPDNKTLGFLSSAASGQAFMLQNVSVDSGDPTVLDTGSPYYWSWSPDGSAMIVHAGSDTSTVPAHVSFLQTTGPEIIEDQLDTTPASFQAPAWSPDGRHILLSRVSDQNKNEIILTDSRGKIEKTIGAYQVNTAFAWSRDSELVAYIDGQTSMTAGTVGKLHVVDTTNGEDFFQDENVIAAFWSPNSKKLAYFKPAFADSSASGGSGSTNAQQQLYLELHILDVNSAKSKMLFTFQPTNSFTSVLLYFDQYHQSSTIWSPDNNNLVLSFLSSQGTPGIAIVAASGQLEPRVLTQGYIAFWSWK